MIGFSNRQNAFFQIESPDIKTEFQNISPNVIDFTYNEEMHVLGSGSLTLRDPNWIYARMFRIGARLLISFGYKKSDQALRSQIGNMMNQNELLGQIERRGILAYVVNPSGTGDQSGLMTLNLNFGEFGLRGNKEEIVHSDGTKASIVHDAFDKLGVSKIYRYINFDRGIERITSGNPIRQEETTFKFLNKCGYEWQALFKIGYTKDGDVAGLFISPRYLGTSSFNKWILRATGSTNLFDYQGKISNVISFSWENKEGESGTGDNTMLSMVDGQMVTRRYVAEQQKVITYRLNPGKIKDGLEAAEAAGGVRGRNEYFGEWIKTDDFPSLVKAGFFTEIENVTAPQGYGYTINCHVIGNPLITPSSEADFGANFPDQIGRPLNNTANKIKWFIRKCSHKINMSGYTTDVEIVDSFSISPTGELM